MDTEKLDRPHSWLCTKKSMESLVPEPLKVEGCTSRFAAPARPVPKRTPTHLRLDLSNRKAAYVDKGTDASDLGEATPSLSRGASPFIRLPLVEDVVIHFADGTPSQVLHNVIQDFKDNMAAQTPTAKVAGNSQEPFVFPATPTSPLAKHFIVPQVDDAPTPAKTSGEYDPFSPDAYNPTVPIPKIRLPSPSLHTETPPTSPNGDASNTRFHDFSITGRPTAVSTQNSLRNVLNIYFPPTDESYQQCLFPQLPNRASLWNPIFGKPEAEKSETKFDLILAIGAQKGVARDFFTEVTSQVESIGTRPGGQTRSGRLDLR